MRKLFSFYVALFATMFVTDATNAETIIFTENFASNRGKFAIENVNLPSEVDYVWSFYSDNSCMKSTAYANGASYAAESWLISPAIDMRNTTSLTLTFDHAAKFQTGNWTDEFQLLVAKNPSSTFNAEEWKNVTIPIMPTSGSWTFVSSGDIDLSDYVGVENVRIAFRYVSSTSAADTWEIKNVRIVDNGLKNFYVYNIDGTTVKFEIAKVDSISFTVPTTKTIEESTIGTENGYSYVDLGLSVKWATCNVGATATNDYGNYYAWGETTTKETYLWSYYKYGTIYSTVSKYCSGITDNKTTLEAADDAATANLGGNWRMPTVTEWEELKNNCIWTWTTQDGMNGYNVKASNGNSIFLPVAGYRYDSGLSNNDTGCYWSSTVDTNQPKYAQFMNFYSTYYGIGSGPREYGYSVRPVCE